MRIRKAQRRMKPSTLPSTATAAPRASPLKPISPILTQQPFSTSFTAEPTTPLTSTFPLQLPVNASENTGFVVYATSMVAYIAYLLWAFLPDAVLHKLGISWYPSRFVAYSFVI